jgi:hypothetical protein
VARLPRATTCTRVRQEYSTAVTSPQLSSLVPWHRRNSPHHAKTTEPAIAASSHCPTSVHCYNIQVQDLQTTADVSNDYRFKLLSTRSTDSKSASPRLDPLGSPYYLSSDLYRLPGSAISHSAQTMSIFHTPRYVPLAMRLTVATAFHPIAGLAGGAFSSVSANGSASPSTFVSFSGALILTPSPLPRVNVCSPLISHRASTFPGFASPSVKNRTRMACVGWSLEKVTSPSRQ